MRLAVDSVVGARIRDNRLSSLTVPEQEGSDAGVTGIQRAVAEVSYTQVLPGHASGVGEQCRCNRAGRKSKHRLAGSLRWASDGRCRRSLS